MFSQNKVDFRNLSYISSKIGNMEHGACFVAFALPQHATAEFVISLFSKVDFEDFKIGSLLNMLKRMIKIKNVVFEGYNGHLGS